MRGTSKEVKKGESDLPLWGHDIMFNSPKEAKRHARVSPKRNELRTELLRPCIFEVANHDILSKKILDPSTETCDPRAALYMGPHSTYLL